jgi:hypothetical protein
MPRLRPPPDNPTDPALLDAARAYVARGWNPVPIPYRMKGPVDQGWQLRVIDDSTVADHFNGAPQNIGIVLGPSSHGLTDVDLDCSEAIELAAVVLPRTAAMFGRASRRASHWLYRTGLAGKVDGAVMQFHDPRRKNKPKSMLVELRIGPGAQTVFPGSVHEETGELIDWDSDGLPAPVDDDADLTRRVRRLAALCLLARYWPGEGGRHQVGLVLGGFLARARVELPWIKYAVEAMAKAAGDEEVSDRRRAADDAAKEHAAGGRSAGIPRMVEMFGQDITDTVAAWLDYPRDGDTAEALPIAPMVARAITFTRFAEITLSKAPRYIIKGLIPSSGLVVVWGPPKCGKSFFLFDMVAHAALGA